VPTTSLKALAIALAVIALVGCSSQPDTRSVPTAAPTQRATPSPAPTEAPADSDDVAASYLDNLLAVIDEASAMAEASCDDLELAQQENPNVFRSVHGFAQTLKGVAAQQPDLTQDDTVKSTLAELDTTMGELDGAFMLCGINPNP